MIYVCIPSYNEAPTIGLLLWKVRQVFAAFPREYHLVVLDDGSTDATREILEPYSQVLPLTVIAHAERRGYVSSVESLLRTVVERTDRPRRDSAILLHADFTHDAQLIPDLVRRIESGADIVVTQGRPQGEVPPAYRLLRRFAPLLLRRAVTVPGVHDPLSGFAAYRLFTLRNALKHNAQPLLTTDGWAANAELLGRAARHARRIETVAGIERYDLRQRPTRVATGERLREVWRASRQLRIPPVPPPPAEPAPSSAPRREREAEAVS